jgi:hypothetical protein
MNRAEQGLSVLRRPFGILSITMLLDRMEWLYIWSAGAIETLENR